MLTFDERLVRSGETGEQRVALFANCQCGSENFLLFQISGHKHFHIQCAGCEESYCPFGACEDDHAEETREEASNEEGRREEAHHAPVAKASG